MLILSNFSDPPCFENSFETSLGLFKNFSFPEYSLEICHFFDSLERDPSGSVSGNVY